MQLKLVYNEEPQNFLIEHFGYHLDLMLIPYMDNE